MSGSPASRVAFDEASHVLTLFRDGRQIARGALQTKLGRQMIEQFLAAYMKAELIGPPRIVCALPATASPTSRIRRCIS